MKFKKVLNQYYKKILSESFYTKKDARNRAAELAKELFKFKKFDLRGTENLPSEVGVVFIYNHINNNESYTLENNFQITLDSHFISSMICKVYYDNPGIRIIRYGLKSEKAHTNYYKKFGYIKVFSKDYLPENISSKEIRDSKINFYNKSKLALSKGENLIINPEGMSSSTEESPSDFKAGVFKMMIRSGLDPIVVPLVMVNFDKLNSQTIYRCEIKNSFRLSEFINNFEDKSQLNQFLISLTHKYKKWVHDLRDLTSGYDKEISHLIEKRRNHFPSKNLIVFYGSSSFRLWKKLKPDFHPYNVLNFGFGGAFLEDCIYYFDTLFTEINPKAIILYVGGNDISLGYTARKINNLFIKLISKIKLKFKKSYIFCVSIKPSYHRLNQIEKIKSFNHLMKEESDKIENCFYINIYDLFIDSNNKIKKDYFVIDNLHLSNNGYMVWKEEIYSALIKNIQF